MAFPAPFAGHSNRKVYALKAAEVPGDLSNHDVVLSFTDTDFRDIANTNGLDIQISDASDNLLDFEIQTWIPATGRLVIWVRVPSLSSSTDTDIKIYFGKASATDVSDPAGLWSVWEIIAHLQESGSGSQGEYVNSVGATHDMGGGFDGTDFGVNTTPTRDGGASDAVPFADHYQDFPGPMTDDTNIAALGVWPEHDVPWSKMTSFVWFAQSATDIDARLWGLTWGASGTDQVMFHGTNVTGSGVFKYRLNSDTDDIQQADLDSTNADESWNLSVLSIDFGRSSSDELTSYIDGAFGEDVALLGATFTTTADEDYRTIGNSGEIFSRSPNGGIVEVRLREDDATADEVAVWWNNQSDPSNFYTVGSLETSTISGTSAGVATATGLLKATGKLVGTSAGSATASATATGDGKLEGASAGAGAATATPTATGKLEGQSDGVGATTATLKGDGKLEGTSAGVGAATGDLVSAPSPIIGQSDGVAVATGTLKAIGKLVGQSDGVATTTATPTAGGALAGQSDGAASVVGLLIGKGALVAASAGAGGAAATLKGTGKLEGTSAGVGGATGDLVDSGVGANNLAGLAAGFATVTGKANTGLVGRSDGTSTATLRVRNTGEPNSQLIEATTPDQIIDAESVDELIEGKI